MRIAGVTAAILAGSSLVAHAHDRAASRWDDPRVFSVWDRTTLAGLVTLAALYWIGSRHILKRGGARSRSEAAAFAAGCAALVAAILPPFDAAVIERFSVHMAQHELMMLVGAPLLVAGRPLSRWLWALPNAWRYRAGSLLQRPVVSTSVRMLTAPAAAWAMHGAALWAWHMPVLYDLAVRYEGVHTIQHAMFVATSLMFWGGLLHGRYGRVGYGAAVLYVFTTAIHTGILGALLTFAGTPLYPAYASIAGGHEEALADQQLAGLLMWIPAGLMLTLLGIALFAAWLGESERRNRVKGWDPPRPSR